MDHPLHGSADRRQALSSRYPGLSPASVSFFFLERGREALLQRSPEIREALRHRTDQILRWMKRGGPWRAFLVSTVGIVLLLGLLGLGSFMLFFLAITVNAVAVGFLASIASIGAFTAVFFTSLTVIYIVALVTAVISVSTTTFFCVSATLMAIGWLTFFWIVWQGLKKGVGIVKMLSVPALRIVTLSEPREFKQRHY